MSREPKRKGRARYFFDRLFSRGTPVLIVWLLTCALTAVAIIAIITYVTGASNSSFGRLVWEGIQRMFDPGGVVSSADPSDPPAFKTGMMASSIVGVIALACLIGLVTTELEKIFEKLKRGRSNVVERGHTLILGWSSHVPLIINEIATANENRKRQSIVILADQDPVELREIVADEVGDTRGTRISFRRGDPTSFNDLETVDFSGARAIIIAPDQYSYSDSLEIKALLAIINHPRRKTGRYHVVLALADASNAAVAKMVAGDEVEVVVFRDVAARIVAHTCLQPGLSVVYTELLDFDGDEIYMLEEPSLVGKTFGESLLAYEQSAVIGLHPAQGGPMLWPPFDTIISAGDKVIAITEDDDTMVASDRVRTVTEEAIVTDEAPASAPQRTLILGWSAPALTIIKELDCYAAPGSQVKVLAPSPEAALMAEKLAKELTNQTLTVTNGLAHDRATLDALDLPSYRHVVVCGLDDCEPQEADAQALLCLLHLRDIGAKSGAKFSVVTEMKDARNRGLATVAKADDFVVSEHLLGLLLAQIAENKHLTPIFADLFDADGAEIHLKPAAGYVKLGVPVDFYTVVEAARRRNEIAIGYRVADPSQADTRLGYGIAINPRKSDQIVFGQEDLLILIAED